MTVYVAGPMTNHPQFNFPLFYRVAAELRAQGQDEVINPAELDSDYIRNKALQSLQGNPEDLDSTTTWGEILARDVHNVADKCNAICLLPGWETSRGALLEAFVGLLCGHEFFIYKNGDFLTTTRATVREKINGSIPTIHPPVPLRKVSGD